MNNPNTTSEQEQNQHVAGIIQRNSSQRLLTPYVLIATGIFLVTLVIGLRASPELTSDMMEELVQTFKPIVETLVPSGPLALLLFIFANNAIKALGALVMGIILGLPPLFFVGGNGFMIGVTVAALHSLTGYGVIVASLAPHGVIEIPMLLLASALGLRIGMESIKFLIGQKSTVKAQLRQGLKIYLKWILAGLFISAIIEVFITPLIVILAGGKELFIK
jgi:stage II sporulation protein M